MYYKKNINYSLKRIDSFSECINEDDMEPNHFESLMDSAKKRSKCLRNNSKSLAKDMNFEEDFINEF